MGDLNEKDAAFANLKVVDKPSPMPQQHSAFCGAMGRSGLMKLHCFTRPFIDPTYILCLFLTSSGNL